MRRRQAEAALTGSGGGIVNLQNAGEGLFFEPLASVALMGSRAAGKLG